MQKAMAPHSSAPAWKTFVKDKVSIGTWIYLWDFFFVQLIYISVFVPVPYCLDDCGFVVEPAKVCAGSRSLRGPRGLPGDPSLMIWTL